MESGRGEQEQPGGGQDQGRVQDRLRPEAVHQPGRDAQGHGGHGDGLGEEGDAGLERGCSRGTCSK